MSGSCEWLQRLILSKKVREDVNVINFLFVLWMWKGNRKLILIIIGVVMPCWLAGLHLIIGVVMPCWLAGLLRNYLFFQENVCYCEIFTVIIIMVI